MMPAGRPALMNRPQDPDDQSGVVADAEATLLRAIGESAAAFRTAGTQPGEGLTAFRAAVARAERDCARALTEASASIRPALEANMRDIEALAAHDAAEGTAFGDASRERHGQLVEARARLMASAMRPGAYVRTWVDELVASVERAARGHEAGG